MVRPELWAIVAVCLLGTAWSVWLLFDAMWDRRVARHKPELAAFTGWAGVIAEAFRLLSQLMLLVAAVILAVGSDLEFLRVAVRYLLLGLPIVIAAKSWWSWRTKRRLLRQHTETIDLTDDIGGTPT